MKITCPKCGEQVENGVPRCPVCGTQLNQQDLSYAPASSLQEPGMKWFKFIIYFQLFCGALLNALTGISCFNGNQYNTYDPVSGQELTSEIVYGVYPSLRYIDIAFAVFTLALVAAAIYIRQQLAHYRKGAPKKYLLFLVVSLAGSVLYGIAAGAVLGDASSAIGDSLASLIANAALLAVNVIYFKKREYLFAA